MRDFTRTMRHRGLALAAGLALVACAAPSLRAQPAYDAAFVTQSAPRFVQFQTPAAASVTMRNTGTATWYQVEGDVFLSTQEPQDNYYWCIQENKYGSHSGNRVLLPYDVAPGQTVTFDFTIKPLSCGFTAAPPFRFRMLSQTFGTFGEETPDPQVFVSTAAEFVAQQVSAKVVAAANIPVTVTFKNTSNITWSPGDGYVLASVPVGTTTWGTRSVALPAAVAPGGSVTFEFFVVAPTAEGMYNFQWQMNLPEGTPFGLASPATSVEVVAAGPPNYQGLWWNSPPESEAGWGLNVAHQSGTIFVTWFTYDLTGKGWWLAMTATAANPTTAPNVFTGTLVRMTGPAFNALPFSPALVRGFSVGTGTLTFTDANNGTFAYTVNGISQTKNITREVFGPLPTCTFGIFTDLTQAYNYQDLWWAAPAGAEAGWGINLTHQGNTIFATWFTFDVDNTPMWLVVTAAKTAAGIYSGTLYRTTGAPFNAVPFTPANVVATSVGTATFTFSDGNDANFAYTVNGVSQTKAITRQVFVSPGTVCQ